MGWLPLDEVLCSQLIYNNTTSFRIVDEEDNLKINDSQPWGDCIVSK